MIKFVRKFESCFCLTSYKTVDYIISKSFEALTIKSKHIRNILIKVSTKNHRLDLTHDEHQNTALLSGWQKL